MNEWKNMKETNKKHEWRRKWEKNMKENRYMVKDVLDENLEFKRQFGIIITSGGHVVWAGRERK